MPKDRDDFEIELGQSVRRHALQRGNPLRDPGRCVVPYDSPGSDAIPVFVSESVMRAIEKHTLGDKEREVGGVLMGGFYRNDQGSFVEVTDFIEAASAKGTDVSLTFTHEAWEQIHEEAARRCPDAQIVGWYHSHPALGVFMSKDDEFIHTSFFSDPWHVAIVVDPIYRSWGCFKWTDGSLERTGGFYVFAEKKSAKRVREYVRELVSTRQPAPRAASAAADRRSAQTAKLGGLWALIALLLILQVVTGYFALSKRETSGSVMNDYEVASRLLSHSDLSGAEDYLRRELISNPYNDRAYRDLRMLNDALSDPRIAKMDGGNFDRTNLILMVGDESAVQGSSSTAAKGPGIKTPVDEYKSNTQGTAIGMDYAGIDPQKAVLEAYTRAVKTRAARIERAKLIDSIAHAKWSREALRWLREEELREIAHGRMVDPATYSERYKNLSASEKKIVNSVLGGKK